MLPAVGTTPDTSATQQGDVGLIYNIKSCLKGNFQAQLAPNDLEGSVGTRW